jgi:TP901 family phage tail tape measure protein
VNARQIAVLLTAKDAGFTTKMSTAAGSVDRFNASVEEGGTKVSKFATLAAGAAQVIGAVLVVALVAAVMQASKFQTEMRNVNSLTRLNEAGFKDLSQSVLDLSKKLPQSATNLASGLYFIASSGFYAADGLKVLKASAIAASAGLSDTETSAKAIVSILNAYGLKAKDAAHVSNVLFQGVNVGILTFDQLANSVGKFVGSAALAQVPIEDATAALAAMTLSGISAEESGTSLNRVIQSFIKPSGALTTQLHKMGYESGITALKQDGLKGVIDKLRIASGGNVETLRSWFKEIRAFRGVAALVAAGGANYARSMRFVQDADTGVGAAQRVLNEQMKSISNQWKVFANNVNYFLIQGGLSIISWLQDVVPRVRDMAVAFGHQLNPFFREAVDIGKNVNEIFQRMYDVAKPVGEVLLTIAGGAVIVALNVLGHSLEWITGLFAKYPALIHAITVALLIMAATKAFDALASGVDLALIKLYEMSAVLDTTRIADFFAGITQLSGGFLLLGTDAGIGFGEISAGASGALAALGPIAAIGAALAVLTLEFSKYSSSVSAANKQAASSTKAYTDQFDFKKVTDLRAVTKGLRHELETAPKEHWFTGLKRMWEDTQFWKPKGQVDRPTEQQRADIKATRKAYSEAIGPLNSYLKNTAVLRKETGLTNPELQRIAKTVGVDLFQGYNKLGTEGRNKILAVVGAHKELTKAAVESGASQDAAAALSDDDLKKYLDIASGIGGLAEQYQLLGDTVSFTTGESVDDYKAAADAAEKYVTKVHDAFAGSMDVVDHFSGQAVTQKSLSAFYQTSIAQATTFSKNIRTAITDGYDPNLISRILQEGPEKASGLLQELVTNHSARMVYLTNASEQAITNISNQAAEMARLTNLAITSGTDQMTKDLSKSMAIAQYIMAHGGEASAQALATALGMKVADVRRIAGEYGIALADGVNILLDGLGVRRVSVQGRGNARTGAHAVAEGGYIDPAVHGDTHKDSVHAILMPGEVVINRKSVKKWGLENLLDLNKGKVPAAWAAPGYASGGFVSPDSVPRPPNVSGYGNMVGYSGQKAMDYEYLKTVDFVGKQMATMAGAPGSPTGGGGAARKLGQILLAQRGWSQFWGSLDQLWTHESGWNPNAQNPTSTAFGIPQFLDGTWAGAGGHKTNDPRLQILYGLNYIGNRYGNPDKAWAFWQQHHYYGQGGQVPYGVYDRGGYLPKGMSIAVNNTGSPEPVGAARPQLPEVHVRILVGTREITDIIDKRVEFHARRGARIKRSFSGASSP